MKFTKFIHLIANFLDASYNDSFLRHYKLQSKGVFPQIEIVQEALFYRVTEKQASR